FETLIKAWNMGVDAVILQDVALGSYIHERRPEICLHLSTQAGVCNLSGAEFAKNCGFSRVILARETPIAEIEKIAGVIETEVFVQGALCTCFSGQCYFSSFIGGNSGNRGRCKQPCRKKYTFNRSGYDEPAYAISLADLCVGDQIDRLKKAGVSSFKIEGRMRRAEYVAAATSYYRNLLDGKQADLSALKRTYNRGNYTKGLGFGQDKTFLSNHIQGHLGEKVGTVKVENKQYFVQSAYPAVTGDAFKVLRKGKEIGGAFFAKSAMRGFYINSSTRLCAGDSVFVTTDTALNARLLSARKRVKLPVYLTFVEGERARAVCDDVEVYSDFLLESARSKPLTKEQIEDCFLKVDGLPIDADIVVDLHGEIFLPKSQLNEFRRSFYAKIVEKRLQKRSVEPLFVERYALPNSAKKAGVKAVIARDFSALSKIDIAIYKPDDYSKALPINFLEGGFEKYLYCPAFCTEDELQDIVNLVKEKGLNGIYAENFAAIKKAKDCEVDCFVGTGLNVTNHIFAEALQDCPQVKYFALSKELSLKESKDLSAFDKAVVLVGGDLKLMDLCYCPFEKTCNVCDKKWTYVMTDEQGREFPVRRYVLGGRCRFEVYNSARLIAVANSGGLADYSITADIEKAFEAFSDEEKQKRLQKNYTFGHAKNGVL
ncbi:MAG: U32 family peptidase, partial [Clostridia bacterium]|nr:U32 family peptidase [Clostridia bacterium]